MKNNFYQIISENKTYNLFVKKLNIPIHEKDKKTFKNKDVDFFLVFKKCSVYVEVKANINCGILKSGSIGENNRVFSDRFLKRSNDKFLENNCNIVVINDSNTLKLSIFDSLSEPLLNLKEEIQNNLNEYPKISALIILSSNYEEKNLEYQIFFNSNPQKYLPDDLVSIFIKNDLNNL